MSTSLTKTDNEGKLANLKKERARIQYEIALLTKKNNKNNPERKADGKVYYLHGTHKNGYPRVTVACHVNEDKGEMYVGAAICSPLDQFQKRTGRVRAMGRAVSSKRQIVKLKRFEHEYVREKLNIYLNKIELKAIQTYLAKHPEAVSQGRKEVTKRIEVVHINVGMNGKD